MLQVLRQHCKNFPDIAQEESPAKIEQKDKIVWNNIVREELAKVSPKSNHSTLYQHAQSLIRSGAYNSVRELQISHVNSRINSSSSSTPTVEGRRNNTSSSGSRKYNNNSNSFSTSQRNIQRQKKL